jgi:hypothetical protein
MSQYVFHASIDLLHFFELIAYTINFFHFVTDDMGLGHFSKSSAKAGRFRHSVAEDVQRLVVLFTMPSSGIVNSMIRISGMRSGRQFSQ